MNTSASPVSVHLAGEGRDDISLDTLPGKFTITRTDAALTPCGGLAAQVVESGRQRTVKLAVRAEWWTVLKACYERLPTWLASTAPQLEEQGDFLRLLSRQHTADPLEWLNQPAPTPTG